MKKIQRAVLAGLFTLSIGAASLVFVEVASRPAYAQGCGSCSRASHGVGCFGGCVCHEDNAGVFFCKL